MAPIRSPAWEPPCAADAALKKTKDKKNGKKSSKKQFLIEKTCTTYVCVYIYICMCIYAYFHMQIHIYHEYTKMLVFC